MAMLASVEANDWISNYLGAALRLVYMPDETRRAINPAYSINRNLVSFADGYPCLLVGASSLADLNQRMESPVPMNRFRPNFVVAGSQPFAEDHWQRVRIGALTFHATKCSVRCMIPMIDQEKGAITSKEPLRALSKYRMRDRQITFGLYMLPLTFGQEPLRTGDAVEILQES